MNATIICVSVSHGNTRRVADVIGQVLGARVCEPEQIDMADLAGCHLVGVGSGIFSLAFHRRLRTFVRSIPDGQRGKAFIFATSGFSPFFGPMQRMLERKGFEIVGTFSCRAYDTWFPFKLVGGLNKGRPDASDLSAARTFAERLQAKIGRSDAVRIEK